MRWSRFGSGSIAILVLAGLAGFAAPAQPAAASRCSVSALEIECSHATRWVKDGLLTGRFVRYQVPEGTPPAGGWPVVLIFQGTGFPVEFQRTALAPFGGYYEAQVIQTLLDAGYAVLAPDADNRLAWYTNFPLVWRLTSDRRFLDNVLHDIDRGRFGPLDPGRMYATGISSGGYNASRVAIEYPGAFRAIAIQSASYMTCSGPVCVVPSLPAGHPPTLFVHGFLDPVVPWWTMDLYYERLRARGVDSEQVTNPLGLHEWLPESAPAILEWFDSHP